MDLPMLDKITEHNNANEIFLVSAELPQAISCLTTSTHEYLVASSIAFLEMV